MGELSKVEKNTGKIYNELFTAYSKKQFEESVELFFMRHKKWGFDLDWFKDKTCLDAGCGGGRFCVAMSKLGAAEVQGIDVSKEAIGAARERVRERGLTQANFTRASVLEIPFEENKFDYVVCSGVILLTPDPFKAFQELVRVLKPGGKMFLSVYGSGGLKWFTNDVFRYTICKIIPFSVMNKIFKMVGVPANKRYNTLDNMYTHFTKRFKEKEIRQWFTDAGFDNLNRVKFERYDYSTMMSRIIHGEGWIQIYADKKKA
jgi:ubiquinone/menaquinone biosynthesis C-methylase UbiE